MKDKKKRRSSFFKDRGVKVQEVLLLFLAVAVVLGAGIALGTMNNDGKQTFPVYISEVVASNSNYPNGDGRCCDYIEIHNSADYAVDLSGFQLGDVAGKSRYAFIPGTILEPGAYMVIYCEGSLDDPAYAPFDISRAGGENFYLIAKNNAILDSVLTLPMDTDQAMVRQGESWTVSELVTPGQPNEALTGGFADIYNSGVSPVRITEFSSAKNGYLAKYSLLCDWVELYNTAEQSVDISGYILSDNVGNDKYTFPQGTVMEAGAYLTVYCTERVTDPEVAPFGLSQTDAETVVLKNAAGMIAEIVRTAPMESGSMALQENGSWVVTQDLSTGYANTPEGCGAFLQATGIAAGNIRISEVSSAGQLSVADKFGEFSDWVELYNPTQMTIDLSGWCLSDEPTQPQKWMIPSLVMEPGSYAVIFCSGRGVAESGELHAEFALSAAGESLTLTAYTGCVVDAVNFPAAEDYTSFVFTDGAAVSTQYPTPAYPNDEQGYEAMCAAAVPVGPLAIWEVMSSNNKYLPQKLGECYDWVELRNVSDGPLDLSGFSITDDLDVPNMYTMKEKVLQPGETAIVILSSTKNVAKSGYEQALFSLDAQDDQLFLFDSNGNLLDYVHLKEIPLGRSYGRSLEDGGFRYMEPSPENPNSAGYRLISSAPVSSYVPGVYSQEDSFSVTLEAAGAIYYTTDGSIPTAKSKQYTEPLQIKKNTVLRAVSVEEGKMASEAYTATFIVGDKHDIPVVSLVMPPKELKKVYKNGDMSVKNTQIASHVSYSGEDGSFAISCGMNLHGATTVKAFDKKSFSLRFLDMYDGPLHYDVFEDGEVTTFRSLIIRTSHESSVSTQMHDAFIGQIAAESSDKILSQKYKYVALYLNGEYWGLYAIRERHSPEHFATYMNQPAEGVTTERYMVYNNGTLLELYNFCENNSLKSKANYEYVKSIIDVEGFADWIIFEAYMANMDINRNIRYYRSAVDGKWYLGLADLDLGIVGSFAAFDLVAECFGHGPVISKLMENKEFQDLLATRLAELLEGPLSDESTLARIDAMAANIRAEAAWEEKRWGTTVTSWENMVKYMKRFCDGRAEEMIDSLCQQLGFSKAQREHYFGHLE